MSYAFSLKHRRLEISLSAVAIFLVGLLVGTSELTAKENDAGNMANLRPDVVVISRDGRTMAIIQASQSSSDFNGEVEILDLQTRKTLRRLTGFNGGVTAVDFSPDARLLASGGYEYYGEMLTGKHKSLQGYSGILRLWDIGTGDLKWSARAHQNLRTIVYLPDGKTIVTGGYSIFSVISQSEFTADYTDPVTSNSRRSTPPQGQQASPTNARNEIFGEVKFWDAHTGQLKKTINFFHTPVRSLILSPGGKTMAILLANAGGEVRVWDMDQEKSIRRYTVGDALINSVMFSPDGSSVAIIKVNLNKRIPADPSNPQSRIGRLTGEVEFRDIKSGQVKFTVKRNVYPLPLLALSPDGSSMVSTAASNGRYGLSYTGPTPTMYLCNVKTGEAIREISGYNGTGNSLMFSPDGSLLVEVCTDNLVRIWDAKTWELKSIKVSTAVNPGAIPVAGLRVSADTVLSIATSPDGRHIVSGSNEKSVVLWDMLSGDVAWKQTYADKSVSCVAYAPSGNIVAAGCDDGSVDIYNATNGSLVQRLLDHKSPISSIAFLSEGVLVSGGDDNKIRLWDVNNGAQKMIIEAGQKDIKSVACSLDGKIIASGGEDGTIKVWDSKSGASLNTFKGHLGQVNAIALSAGAKYIASAGEDKIVKLWDIQSGRELHSLSGHSGPVTAVAFSTNGSLIASGGDDKTARLWDLESGHQVKNLKGHDMSVSSIAFSRDGSVLACGTGDNSIVLWNIATLSLKRILKEEQYIHGKGKM